jgi:cytochrome c5
MFANRVSLRLASACLFFFATTIASAMGSRAPADEEAVLSRIAPVARVQFADAPAGPAVAKSNRSGEELYKAVCSACHAAGVAGSPKFANATDWAPRIAKGLDGLMTSAVNGTAKGMPPKGGSDANVVELTRAVAYMANKAGANFKAP